MNANALAALLVAILAAVPPPASGGRSRLIVIVPESQTLSDLSVADLRRIYLGEITRWPNGRRIIPVILPPGSRDADLFLKRVVQMSMIDYSQHWIGVVFQGRAAAAPLVVATPAEAVHFVATHPDAIAVIGDQQDLVGPVRIAAIEQRSPKDADYPLQW